MLVHVLTFKLICIAVVSCVMSLLLLEADKYIIETALGTEELRAYVSKSWRNWNLLQIKNPKKPKKPATTTNKGKNSGSSD